MSKDNDDNVSVGLENRTQLGLGLKFGLAAVVSILISASFSKWLTALLNNFINLGDNLVYLHSIVDVAVLIIVLELLLNKLIIAKVKDLITIMERVEEGELDISDLDVSAKDEIGILKRKTNSMVNQLQADVKEMMVEVKDSISELSSYSEELSASAEEGNATIENTNQLIENISGNIQQISASSQEVNSFAQESAS
ncbi:MAG: methyl-accepting chemotaxis protein, partial [Halanaerobacter sp.]